MLKWGLSGMQMQRFVVRASSGSYSAALSALASHGLLGNAGRHVGWNRLAATAAPVPLPMLRTRTMYRSLFIKVEATPNPDSIKFVPDNRVVLPERFGGGVHFSSGSDTSTCALAQRLLKYKEITSVFLGRDFISVNKRESANWTPLRPLVLNAIMDAFSDAVDGGSIISDAKPLTSEQQPGAATDEDDEVVAMIKELLETRIRPAVQEDGGDIFYAGFSPETGIVRVKMAGSCVGCPSSTATLRNGVENMLMHYIPEVKGIEQVKDAAEAEGDAALAELEKRIGEV